MLCGSPAEPLAGRVRVVLSGPGMLAAQVKEDRKVSRLVAGPESKVGVVEFVTAMCINTPLTRALWHDEKPRAFTTRIVQGTETPLVRVARCRKLRVCEHVFNFGECAHVEVHTQ